MKRLLITALMLILFVFGTGCEKDEVVAPEGKDDFKQSVEVAEHNDSPQDVVAEKEESEDVDSAEKTDEAEGTDASTKEEPAAKPSQQVNTKSNSSLQQETNKNTQSPAQENKKTVNSTQSSKTEQPKESTKKSPLPQEKSSNTTTQKPTSEKPTTEKPKEVVAPAPTKPSPTPEPTKPKETVTITIVAPGVKDTILPVTSVEFQEGDTVLSITQKIVRARGIQISVTGASATAYVQGIDNLYEFDHGPLSGWEAFVNGQGLDRSAGVYGVQPGQAIMWRYTKNYTE
ncbi:DUF4430 domain-containing protein [Mesobacillus maritimus]|uniref:DUF4430 domain-containing protein n=1 Tax=Mesobacillus maritimus TaxID=1643336 RepID=A0ABS7KAC2_9BACI|nr:DUF4430 domain-containing protein [Mesobacillus maritimus]MBY0099231.1 DUF4430 domain-containing protein [Mesobacillus maritimus]